jgi:beta-lysine N6-acetyltransferase
MIDQIEKLSHSLIQHGSFSNRIYIMELSPEQVEETIRHLEQLAHDKNYTKIIVKAPHTCYETLNNAGYFKEAIIPHFYNGKEDLYFMSKFYSEKRESQKEKKKAASILTKAIKKHNENKLFTLKKGYAFSILNPSDAKEMTVVFKETFGTYPFPIFDESYLIETMGSHVIYFGIRHNGQLVAISSCEMYESKSAVEMTDFAILNDYRGKKLSIYLLQKMEEEMIKRNIKTAYSMSNAQSYGMNITFAKFGYRYTGTLINNANLGGSLKSLNIWYKSLTSKN